MSRLRKEPALLIGLVATVILAAVQYASGNLLISTDLAGTIQNAIDPTTGWAIPIILGFITRWFVSPATSPGL